MRLYRTGGVKLWEEELDPTELDFFYDPPIDAHAPSMNQRVLHYLIEHELKGEQRKIINAYLAGKTYKCIKITEKAWRYHMKKAVTIMRQKAVDKKHQNGLT